MRKEMLLLNNEANCEDLVKFSGKGRIPHVGIRFFFCYNEIHAKTFFVDLVHGPHHDPAIS